MAKPATARSRQSPRRGRAANPANGEHEVELGGQRYLLRPSFSAVQAIYDEIGLSAERIVGEAERCALSPTQIGVILGELIRAGAAEGSYDALVADQRIAELAFEAGTASIQLQLVGIFVDVILGGRDAEGNAKAVATQRNQPNATAE